MEDKILEYLKKEKPNAKTLQEISIGIDADNDQGNVLKTLNKISPNKVSKVITTLDITSLNPDSTSTRYKAI